MKNPEKVKINNLRNQTRDIDFTIFFRNFLLLWLLRYCFRKIIIIMLIIEIIVYKIPNLIKLLFNIVNKIIGQNDKFRRFSIPSAKNGFLEL